MATIVRTTEGDIVQDNAAPGSAPVSTPPKARTTRAARLAPARALVLELAAPLAGYYVLKGLGASQWAALAVSGLLLAPWIAYGMVKRRRVEAMPVFTLTLLVVGALMSMVTGDPRTLLVRDSWLFGVVGLWVLGTLATQRPFMLSAGRTVVASKIGEEGAREWMERWHQEADFRRHIRVITAVWGAGFTADALIRVVLAQTLPVDSVPLVNGLQWPAVLAALFVFHYRYVTRHGLKV
ncbi:VC0807 family protein [Kitasatospora sp. NPDC091207]|uniref:VC0807 family protein n=1 Tax=Kitasatospora sp. NPDC091207 TaxID=3364083 RepID=UPI0038238A67